MPASPLLRLLRPRQWVKNLLVFAGPAAGAALDDGAFVSRSVTMFVAFCLAASGMYCINDAADAAADRLHPVKRRRPVASGEVAPRIARRLGAALVVAAVLVAAATGDPEPFARLGRRFLGPEVGAVLRAATVGAA